MFTGRLSESPVTLYVINLPRNVSLGRLAFSSHIRSDRTNEDPGSYSANADKFNFEINRLESSDILVNEFTRSLRNVFSNFMVGETSTSKVPI